MKFKISIPNQEERIVQADSYSNAIEEFEQALWYANILPSDENLNTADLGIGGGKELAEVLKEQGYLNYGEGFLGFQDLPCIVVQEGAELSEAKVGKTVNKNELWYQVIEDNGGGLALFILDKNGKVVYGATGYEHCPGSLSEDIANFMQDGNIEDWEVQTDSLTGEPIDAQAIYDDYDNYEYGWEIVAQGDYYTREENKWYSRMGAAAKREFKVTF